MIQQHIPLKFSVYSFIQAQDFLLSLFCFPQIRFVLTIPNQLVMTKK